MMTTPASYANPATTVVNPAQQTLPALPAIQPCTDNTTLAQHTVHACVDIMM